MFDLTLLTYQDLINRSTITEILKLTASCIDSPPATSALACLLERKIKKAALQIKNPDFYKVYQTLILLLKFESLNLLSDQEVLDLIEKNVLEALTFKSHFFDKLKSKLFSLPIIFRDDFLLKLKGALQRNKQRLGKKPIKLIQYPQPVEPFVSFWLLDYDTSMGYGPHREADQELYLWGSPNVKTLTKKEKDLLSELLGFYDLLGISSREPGGLASYSLGSIVGFSRLDPKLLKEIEKIWK